MKWLKFINTCMKDKEKLKFYKIKIGDANIPNPFISATTVQTSSLTICYYKQMDDGYVFEGPCYISWTIRHIN